MKTHTLCRGENEEDNGQNKEAKIGHKMAHFFGLLMALGEIYEGDWLTWGFG
jgi:hypothetical protein